MSLIPNGLTLPRLIDKLNLLLGAQPAQPVLISVYATPAALPPATNYVVGATPSPQPGAPNGATGLVMVASIPALAYSNGANWLRADTGASIA